MRLYVAGPMSGLPLWNYPAFEAATARLRAGGHDVVSPMEMDEDNGWVEVVRDDDGAIEKVTLTKDFDFRTAIAADLAVIDRCDGIVLLDGWEDSVGARIERAHAVATGKVVLLDGEDPETVLEEAQRLIFGDRNAAYGHPAEDFARTGRMWGAILGIPDVPPAQVGLCMAALKISREVHRPKRDNLVDLAGYAGTVAMVRERELQAQSRTLDP